MWKGWRCVFFILKEQLFRVQNRSLMGGYTAIASLIKNKLLL